MNRKINYIIGTKKYRVREYKSNKERTVGYFDNLKDAKICQGGHHWLEGLVPDPTKAFGFIYIISDNLTGMEYVGKKQYYFYERGHGDSSNDITSKSFNPECWVESDWKYYTSSSKILAPIIAERYDDFSFDIVQECTSKLSLLTEEIYWQQRYDVLNAVLPNGERKYYNQNVGGCDFNIHDSGEVARSFRYNPLYQAWSKAMMTMDVSGPWTDPKLFIKDNSGITKDYIQPVVGKIDEQPLSPYNITFHEADSIVESKSFMGIIKEGNLWLGRIQLEDGRILEARGVSERHVAAEMDDIIDKEGIDMEKQLQWV